MLFYACSVYFMFFHCLSVGYGCGDYLYAFLGYMYIGQYRILSLISLPLVNSPFRVSFFVLVMFSFFFFQLRRMYYISMIPMVWNRLYSYSQQLILVVYPVEHSSLNVLNLCSVNPSFLMLL